MLQVPEKSEIHASLSNAKSLVLFTTCLAVFIAQLDTSVVNLALKHIGASLSASVSQLQWVIDAYNLVYASFLLTAGILGDRFGHRGTLVAGFVLFGAGSLLCGIAPEAWSLIAGRAITGLGAAFVIPASLAILSSAYSDHKERAYAIGVWASCNGLAWVFGPAAGGLVVDYLSWRGIFLVIVPVSILGCLLGLRCISESFGGKKRGLDLAGQILAVLALGGLSFGFIEAPHRGWTSTVILSSFALALVAVLAFIAVERRAHDPLVPGFLFKKARFPAALVIAISMTFAMYAMVFLVPIYLQTVRQDSAFMTGIEMLAMSISFFFVSRASGQLAVRFGPRDDGGRHLRDGSGTFPAFAALDRDQPAQPLVGAGRDDIDRHRHGPEHRPGGECCGRSCTRKSYGGRVGHFEYSSHRRRDAWRCDPGRDLRRESGPAWRQSGRSRRRFPLRHVGRDRERADGHVRRAFLYSWQRAAARRELAARDTRMTQLAILQNVIVARVKRQVLAACRCNDDAIGRIRGRIARKEN
jgi:DHA2 family methylenomycin A resistance protein-like MFS transporter